MTLTATDSGQATLSTRQAAWALGVPVSQIHRAIRVGMLRAVRRRSLLIVREADVRRLMCAGAA